MPRVDTRVKSARGAERHCQAQGCGRKIEPGERYHTWTPYRSSPRFRCAEHPPRPADLTQSKMSDVYAAQDEAERQMVSAESVEDVKSAVDGVAEVARTVVEEYREAAEMFGGGGENAERADELEGWVDELDSFEPEVPEFDEDEAEKAAKAAAAKDWEAAGDPWEDDPSFETDVHDRMQALRDEWDDANAEEAVDAARQQASELLGGCPL